jgi:curved DNA-binding protein CbpA
MVERSYYVVLGVSRGESPAGIRAAYRDLAKRHHPDVSGDAATRSFQEIAEAYRVLSDPQARRSYDERLRRLEPRQGAPRRPLVVTRSPEPISWEPFSVMGAGEVRPSREAMHDRFRRNFTGRGVPKAERLEPLDGGLHLLQGLAVA